MMLPPLIGHTDAKTQLATLLAGARFPHALLMHGPQGIGKRTLAEHLAYRLICGPTDGAGQGADMFGNSTPADPLAHDVGHPACAQLQAGSCPDFHVLAPEEGKKSIGIDAARDLLATLQRSADTARVVVIDALEQLTDEAANALLKMLEEPRPNIYFLLVCHQLSATLPTIRSRCRLLRLHPLSLEDTGKVLVEVGGDVNLAPLAKGCPGTVLGKEAQTLHELMAHLRPALQGQSVPAPSTAQAPLVPQALLALLAEHTPTPKQAEAYAAIATLMQQARTLNLPHTLVAEQALGVVASC
ncbi:MAG: AAA family ATPase [Pseudomonadaceae bacterium]|nr:AAA family ATPase [Pseudomonadaceae bacterium]